MSGSVIFSKPYTDTNMPFLIKLAGPVIAGNNNIKVKGQYKETFNSFYFLLLLDAYLLWNCIGIYFPDLISAHCAHGKNVLISCIVWAFFSSFLFLLQWIYI